MQWGLHPADFPMDNGQYRTRPVQIHATVLDEQDRAPATSPIFP